MCTNEKSPEKCASKLAGLWGTRLFVSIYTSHWILMETSKWNRQHKLLHTFGSSLSLGVWAIFFCFIYSHVYIRSYKFVSHLPFFSLSSSVHSQPSLLTSLAYIPYQWNSILQEGFTDSNEEKKIRLAFLNTRNSHDIVSGQKENQQPYLSLYV